MQNVIKLFVFLFLFGSCMPKQEAPMANYEVIPLPQQITKKEGTSFKLSAATKIVYPAGNHKLAQSAGFLSDYIYLSTGIRLEVSDKAQANGVTLKADYGGQNAEGYCLTVTPDGVTINGNTEAGTFYGIQTLRKSLPVMQVTSIDLPPIEITDAPRFEYRGMMLDVSRHTFPVAFVKKYIDILALHNINRFHWHLSDDQGWRIEIKKYPQLTEIGSTRKETVIGQNSGSYDGKAYGGFFTQAEAKEVVQYAADRFITVVPEIDLPGHMLAALTAYPELGCTGGPYEVASKWGVFDDVLCVGNEQTFTFLEDVFSELLEIFPSEYIHVGGDECPKVRWKTCPKCQARIKSEGIKADAKHSAEDRLQSYCISRIEKFLNTKGRQIIGWDEILEGGLAPNATVMSWRGMEGGTQAAKEHHKVIMTPGTPVYFDQYQTLRSENEPLAIGGFSNVQHVYNFEPVPAELTPDEAKYIIGTQANLWTEYIATGEHVEYMVVPRIAALSEVQWGQREGKNYDAFLKRLFHLCKLYDKMEINYAKHIFEVQATSEINAEKGTITVNLSTLDNAPIYYTLDGTQPTASNTLYTQAIEINKSTELRAVVVNEQNVARERVLGAVYAESFQFNKATLKPITLIHQPAKNYTYSGASTLVDSKKGGANYRSGLWLGFYNTDFEAIVDLLVPTEISSVSTNTNVNTGDWVFGATDFVISVSDDGVQYREVSKMTQAVVKQIEKAIFPLVANFKPITTRYVKIKAGFTKEIPAWHAGKGKPSFLFTDEIVIN